MKSIWIYVVNHSKGIIVANSKESAKRKIITSYFLKGKVLELKDVHIYNAEEGSEYLKSDVYVSKSETFDR